MRILIGSEIVAGGDNMLAAIPDIIGQVVGASIGRAMASRATPAPDPLAEQREGVALSYLLPPEAPPLSQQPRLVVGASGFVEDVIVGDVHYRANVTRVPAGGSAVEEMVAIYQYPDGSRGQHLADNELLFSNSGGASRYIVVASTQHPNGSISYLVGEQGGQFYPASLGVEGAHVFPGLDLTITNQVRGEVAALRLMGDFARNPITQAVMQVPGFISMTALETVAPRAYDQMQQIGAQAGQMWMNHVGQMVAEGRMSPRTGNDLAVGLPTAVAVTTAAMGTPRLAQEAGVGARMMARSMPRISLDIDVRASQNGLGALGYVRLRSQTPAQRAAANGYPLIGTTSNGGPDFQGTPYLYPVNSGQQNVVRIALTESRRGDNAEAFRLAGIRPDANIKEHYRWHHLDDYDPTTGQATMQLVERRAHEAASWHGGAIRQWELHNGHKYGR